MKYVPRMILLSLMLVLFLSQTVYAQNPDQSTDVLVIDDGQSKILLAPYLEILKDTSSKLTIEEVTRETTPDQWFTTQAETPNFGFQTVPFWVRFRVRNQSEQVHNWVLAQGFWNMHYMDLYILEPDGEGFSVVKNGIFSGTETLNSPFSYLSFNLDIPPGSEQVYYLRFQSDASMTLPLVLWSSEAYTQQNFLTQIGLGGFYAILLVIAVYNGFFFINLREKEYLYLFLFSAGLLIENFCYDGMIAMFIPAIPPRSAIYLLLISLGTYDFAYIKFVDAFLDLKSRSPKIHLIAEIIAYSFLLFGFSGLVLPYKLVANLLLMPAIIVAFLIFIVILYYLIKGERAARYLLVSQVFFLIGAVLLIPTRLGVIPSNFITENLQRLGLAWMALVWSLALANRMHVLKTEAEVSRLQVEENEKRLAQYLDSMPFGVVVYDSDFHLRYINHQAKSMLISLSTDVSFDQLMNSSLEEASGVLKFTILQTDQPYPLEQLPFIQAAAQQKPAYIDDLEIELGDEKIPLEVWSNPIMSESGEFIGSVVAFQNIQDRLLQDELLQRSEEFRRKILEGSSIGTWMIDLISGETIWDSRTREIFGLDQDEPASLDLRLDLIHPEDRQSSQTAFEKTISDGSNGSYEEEIRIIRPDGQVRWISTRGNIIYEKVSGKRQAARLVGIVMDVTQQKQAEKQLEESRLEYKNLIETMNEGLAIVNENLVLTYVNPRLPEMLGYSPEEMVGEHVSLLFDQENFGIVSAQFEDRKTGQEQPYTVTFRRKDGTELHSLVAPAVVFDEQENFLHSIAVVSDISEQVKANQLLDKILQERKLEISALMEVSQIIVDPLGFEDQLKNILQRLSRLIQYDQASIILNEESQEISETDQQNIGENLSRPLLQPFLQRDLIDSQFWRGETLIISNFSRDRKVEPGYFEIIKEVFNPTSHELESWIGIPIKSKNSLVGVLSAHAAQEDFFTQEMAVLMQAFANQIAIIFENKRLYKQARTTAAAIERNRIARELHDSVTQALFSVRLYAEATRKTLVAGKTSIADKNLQEIIDVTRSGMGNLRLLIFELRPPVLEELGLIDALQKRIETVEKRSGLVVNYQTVGKVGLSRDLETQVYWAVYEALSNVLKHAHASKVDLTLNFQPNRTTITLSDDGVGFDPATLKSTGGLGLKNVAERIESFGGRLEIHSHPGKGTVLKISLDH